MKSIIFDDEKLAHLLEIETLWWADRSNENIKQPYVRHGNDFYMLNSKMHEWFESKNIEYSLSFVSIHTSYSTISFKKDSDAVLFKLVWM
jgi:hypothetical protein